MKEAMTIATVTIGAGVLLGLNDAQLAPRAHQVDLVKKAAGKGGRTTVRANVPLQFKAGETIEIAEIPKYLADKFATNDAGKAEPEKSAAETQKLV